MKVIGKILIGVLSCILVFGAAQAATTKKINAQLSAKKVKVGKTISVQTDTKNVRYSSSDSTIAYVNGDGIITGKKPGRVNIKVKRDGYATETYLVTVEKTVKKPNLPVTLDEVRLVSPKLIKNDNGNYTYSACVKNIAKQGTIKKIVYTYRVKEAIYTEVPVETPGDSGENGETPIESPGDSNENDETLVEDSIKDTAGKEDLTDSNDDSTAVENNAAESDKQEMITQVTYKQKTVNLVAKSIKAGKKSAVVSCLGDASGKLSDMCLTQVQLYAGDALYVYNVTKDSYTLKWGTPDTKAPVFRGWVGKESIYNGCALRVCYDDRKSTYQFKDHVTVTDARDGKVSFSVDTSKLNWDKEGVYKVIYKAKDSVGNVATAWAKVQIYKKGTAESIADEVLHSITKNSWSDEKKLRAIYRYAKSHCSYVDTGTHTDWRGQAVNGIRYQSGDCFTFYSIARLLITRAGVPNIEVNRYPKRTGYNHWWNLVYVRGGWYHIDTTPRTRDGKFCLVTDAQLRTYSTGSTFRFDEKKYPKRATKIISPNP